MNINLTGKNGKITQLDDDRLRIEITDPEMLKTYNKVYIVPIADLSEWLRPLEVTHTNDYNIAFSDWFA